MKKQRKIDEEEYEIPKSVKEMKKKKKKKNKKKIFLRILLVFIIIIIILAGIVIGFVSSKFAKIEYDDIDETQIEVNEGIETTGYRNILLLGVDSRKNNYENTLSDSIMVVSINQDTKKVRIASVYRDSYLKIGGKSFDKVTHAFAKGGATLSLSTINTNLDLDLKEYVAINFNVAVDVIDAIGGIDLELTSAEVKWINGYINEVNQVTGHESPHITEPGMQHLDGVQAVSYARIRYTAGGDYKRAERQRVILDLSFQKVKKMNLIELNKLADKILVEISTNVPANQLAALLAKVGTYEIEETTGWPFDVMDYQPDKVWYAAPVDLAKQVRGLHEFLFDEENYQVSNTLQSISDELAKKTGTKSTKNKSDGNNVITNTLDTDTKSSKNTNTNKNVNTNKMKNNGINTNTNKANTNTNVNTNKSKNTNTNKSKNTNTNKNNS